MLFSIVEFMDVLLEKRRSVALISICIAMLLVSITAPILQANRASITGYVRTWSNYQATPSYDNGPDIMANTLSQMTDDIGNAANTIAIKTLSGALTFAETVTNFYRAVGQAGYDTAALTAHIASICIMATVHIVGDSFAITRHAFDHVFGLFSGLRRVRLLSVIQPTDHTPIPTITQIRIQQAATIESGTKGVTVTSAVTTGTGGLCDNGEGNGGYPLGWCNAPIDTLATIPYTSEPINRECTSYAFWYFTTVEGHTNFKAWGNAKYWASTSNYPTHTTPAVGAIAVETAGAYGHVAIVQALPGQKYAGQVVPAGYVLVSEMNYDWQGHFRYSYSPLTKFSAYIYP